MEMIKMRQRNARGGRRPFTDQEDLMKSNLLMIRVFIDRGALVNLAKLASAERRTQQRQAGLLLERITDLYRESPQKLIDLGLLGPSAISFGHQQ